MGDGAALFGSSLKNPWNGLLISTDL